MKIVNDQIIFDSGDIANFSPVIQAALAKRSQISGKPVEEILSKTINSFLASVRVGVVNDQKQELDKIAVALVNADVAVAAAAQVKLDEAKAVLGVNLAPGPKDEIPAAPAGGFLGKLKNLFVG